MAPNTTDVSEAYHGTSVVCPACKHGRACLGQALARAVRAGDLTAREALEAAADILHNNALRVYRLSARHPPSQSPDSPSSPAHPLAPVPVPSTLPTPLEPSAVGGGTVPSGAVTGGGPKGVPAGGQAQGDGGSLLVRLLFADTSGQRRTRVSGVRSTPQLSPVQNSTT